MTRTTTDARLRSTSRAMTWVVALTMVCGLAFSGIAPTQVRAQSDNARSGDYPTSVTVEEVSYIFDREVPLERQDLTRVEQNAEVQIFARSETGPFDAVYVSVPNRSEDVLGRYTAVRLGEGDPTCAAEAISLGVAAAGEESYAFAGFETDVTAESLQSIGQSAINGEDSELLAAPDDDGGFSEFFASNSQGLLRFVQLDGGVPVSLPATVTFGDQELSDPASAEVDLAGLTNVGCIGAFPAFAPETESPFSQIVVQVGDTEVAYEVGEAEATQDEPEEGDETATAEGGTAEDDEPTEEGEGEEDVTPTEEGAVEEDATPTEEGDTGEATETVAGDDDAADEGDGDLVAGRPDAFALTVIVAETTFLFDRMVTIDVTTLVEVGTDAEITLYAENDSGTYGRVFGVTADTTEGIAARYYAVVLDDAAVCPADGLAVGQTFPINDVPYAFAGIEGILTTESLVLQENLSVQVGGEAAQAYADAGEDGALPEIFLDTTSGFLRFISLGDSGVPSQYDGSIVFGTQTISAAVSVQIDVATLTKVGCLGAFPAYAPAGETASPFTAIYAALSGVVVQFTVEGDAEPAAVPADTETAVPADTETPVPADTETPVPADTETPVPADTETPVPADTETPVPDDTETPVPDDTETPVPADTETPVPADTETAVPADTETAVPADTETAVPADTATTAATEAPTTAPTETAVAPGGAEATAAPPTAVPATAVPATAVPATAVPSTTVPPPPATQVPPSIDPAAPVATIDLAPIAVVPTFAPNLPPPAAATAAPRACTGNAGAYNARGLPDRLPSRIQLAGIAYNFVQIEDVSAAGTLTRIGCVGAFTAVSTDQGPQAEILYLQYEGATAGQASLFRYEVGVTFTVEFQISGNPQSVASADVRYNAFATWQQVTYASLTVILFAETADNLTAERYYAKRVDASVIGEYAREDVAGEVPDGVSEAGATYELNPDLVILGMRYILVAVWTPSGTTTNGFVTLYAPSGTEGSTQLLGINVRLIGLLIYRA